MVRFTRSRSGKGSVGGLDITDTVIQGVAAYCGVLSVLIIIRENR